MKIPALRLILAAVLAASCAAFAQPYPERPITFVVPFAAGGATDTLARRFAERMSRGAPQPIIIENVAGAGGTVGAAKVAKAKPDGYTLLVGHVGYMAAAPSLYKELGYDPVRDFDAVARFPDTPLVLVAARNGRFQSVAALVDSARKRPGSVNVANAGVGSSGHLVAALFAGALGLDVVHVSYKGNAPALTDILGGQVDCMFDQSNTALPQVRGGKLVALATTARERLPQMPDVPTVDESLVKGFDATTWYGIYAPRGTPRSAIEWLGARFEDAMKDDAFTAKMVAEGYVLVPADARGAEPLAAHTKREVEVWRKVVKDAGITPN
jgi:tripartite-type tricarboxylate transporter receptor subunit TctC